MCDKSPLDNLLIIGGECDRGWKVRPETGCVRSRFGYTASGEMAYISLRGEKR